jgi:hypothetical protein
MKDPFTYSARWDSVGLDCSYCKYFKGPQKWPDTNIESVCTFHNFSLKMQLQDNGYKDGEWFCKNFNNERAFPKAVEELESIRGQLKENTLYKCNSYDKKNELIEFEIKK